MNAREREDLSNLVDPKKRNSSRGTEAQKAEKKPVKKERVAADVSVDVLGRAKSAWFHAHYHEGCQSYALFVERALEREIERIEKEYLDGKKLKPVERLTGGRKS